MMGDFNYTVKSGDKGLSYIFLQKAEENGYTGDSKKINWKNVMSVFDQIQAEEQAEGQKLYSGGNDKGKTGWGNSYIIKIGDVIDLTSVQLKKIYEAMGFTKTAPTPPVAEPPVTEPPVTKPPVTEPPVTEPPSPTEPPKATTPPPATTPPAKGKVPMPIETSEMPYRANTEVERNGLTYCYDEFGRLDHIKDENGKWIESYYYNFEGGLANFYNDEYDENGNIIRSISYNADGSVLWYDVCEYDENGNNTRSINYNADGSVDYFSDSEYDENGNNTRSISYKADGSASSYEDYEYDENGKCIHMTRYNPDGTVRE